MDERVFPRHADVLRSAIARAIVRLGWQAKNGSDGTIAAVWTSPFFKFKDDVTILVVPAEKGATRVRVRSISRVGRYDFGQNAKHIRDLFTEIQKAL
jgi:uncharacterized protein (DUF1499 family)